MPEENTIPDLTFDDRGLIPAIVQDRLTGEVLMLAYMNSESLRRTLESGRTWFWSRSRQELWNKGATSGHFQFVSEVRYDCDLDCLLVTVEQRGPACHTGEHTCFHRTLHGGDGKPATFEVLTRLFELVEKRRRLMPPGSYTASLLAEGPEAVRAKVSEEAAELVDAEASGEREEVIQEAADLGYHVCVLLSQAGVNLTEVFEELRQRWR